MLLVRELVFLVFLFLIFPRIYIMCCHRMENGRVRFYAVTRLMRSLLTPWII
ncbi:hypothetical protein PLICRDRAFT_44873 [Plicaturopsis crispa FD-325 SS-3]|nr:hypothetical protein PLICRDRAFT_44873 [Plicaturopsis crispa FD-325 SS-3]